MTSTISATPESANRPATSSLPLALVFCCTILGATAQMLMKIGMSQPHSQGLTGYLTSLPLAGGYALYAINTVMLVFALREGELSILYPIIALTYVWVTIASIWLFHESFNLVKVLGVAIVVLGVAMIGRGSKS